MTVDTLMARETAEAARVCEEQIARNRDLVREAGAAAHRRFGTTGMLPTLISDDPAVTAAATEEALRQGVPGVLGIHVEGPYLNPAKRGIHDAEKFTTISSTSILTAASPALGSPGM